MHTSIFTQVTAAGKTCMPNFSFRRVSRLNQAFPSIFCSTNWMFQFQRFFLGDSSQVHEIFFPLKDPETKKYKEPMNFVAFSP